jgi:hypothetical protein
MKAEDQKKITKDLADEDLAALNDAVQAEIRDRRPKVTLDMIRPGMSKEDDAAVRAALMQAAKDLSEGR